jgi:hypothetical protein
MNASIIPLAAIVLSLGGALVWGLVATVAQMAVTISRQRAEANLKLEMIRRGYTASDIERICNVQVPPGTRVDTGEWNPVTPPPKPAKV